MSACEQCQDPDEFNELERTYGRALAALMISVGRVEEYTEEDIQHGRVDVADAEQLLIAAGVPGSREAIQVGEAALKDVAQIDCAGLDCSLAGFCPRSERLARTAPLLFQLTQENHVTRLVGQV